jgi:hypothetical protein
MKISQLLKPYFAADVRGRAVSYTYGPAVRIRQGDSTGVSATVRGSSTYDVDMTLADDGLHMSCTCPYYTGHAGACKHLWALVLTAERDGYLSELLRQQDADVIFDYEDSDDESDAFDDMGPADDDDAGVWNDPLPRRRVVVKPKKAKAPKKERPAEWSRVFDQIKHSFRGQPGPVGSSWPDNRQLLYVIDAPHSVANKTVLLEVALQERKKNGDWGKPKFQGIGQQQAEQIREGPDAAIMPLLFGAQPQPTYGYGYGYRYDSSGSRFTLAASRCRAILPLLGKTGRLFVRLGSIKDQIVPVRWDDGPAWQLRLRVETQDGGKNYQVTGWLCRGEERQPVTQPAFVVPAGVVIWPDCAAFLDDGGAAGWLTALRKEKALQVSAKQKDEFLRDLLLMPQLPPIDLPEELHVAEERVAPKPKIVIRQAKNQSWRRALLNADLAFEYAERPIAFSNHDRGIYDAEAHRLLVRDGEAERAAATFLHALGFRAPTYYARADCDFELPSRLLPKATRALLEAGWRVEAEGKLYRSSGAIHIEVTTGIDWFDLEGNVQFDDQVAPLPRLLQALKKGENTIQLDDGTFGMLPEDWLKKYGMLAGLGSDEDGELRFSKMQAGLLDALLATMPEVSVDEAFRMATEELRRFEGIKAVEPPPEFVGTLREYQREGLGWLRFLERFGFGGCLADDMGLGKTVQILALLAGRAKAKKPSERLPTLIVVPRSLVFNWQQEAARFAPQLKLLDHTGLARGKTAEHFRQFDIVVTTYGTLRRDVLLFKDAKFDYCILDEAQIVKNAGTDQAKATRLLQAHHRLALSGTPVENHLGELWSLFEFLNPGLLGHASVFKLAGGAARNPEPETRAILAKGLRPFILRRTKQQVAKDLPEKTEQTLYCELESEQRKLYDELREHYRQSLAKTIEAVGMNRAKIQVLEALLRLRQAACHPGLIDKKKTADASAKLDMLFPYLEEAIEAGQKTLVFSQFTSFLAILRAKLDHAGIAYEYLDGKTRNRQEKVERFQNDPDCRLFLISLKAGGVGLNLTAAEYVFLLDPWWNPAVEAQAIDRTHRIGQTKPVFAYRLIAKNTVEEKVLELQKTKRDLADAILNADNSVISNLKREDLEMLLS